jgi:cytochrome b6-f complex iron-sulfur subunit
VNVLLRAASAIVISWSWLYTLGLPRQDRGDRRALIESDIWEQCRDPSAGNLGTAASLAGRCLRGAFDDLVWRLSYEPEPRLALQPAGGAGWAEPPSMGRRSPLGRATTPIMALFAAAFLAVSIALPFEHSLALAGVVALFLALAGWHFEAAAEADEPEPGPSFWPFALAASITLTAAGLLIGWRYGAVLVAAPLALLTLARMFQAYVTSRASAHSTPPATAATTMNAASARGAAPVFEVPEGRSISRRGLLRTAFWVGAGASLAGLAATLADFLWERHPGVFGGVVAAGMASEFPPGTKTVNREGRFWLVNLTAEQGGPGFIALWRKCPHLGCTVPWEPNFVYKDPMTEKSARGGFRCPAPGPTYHQAGVRVAGPAPRSMDRMKVTINPDTGVVSVDTGAITKGAPDNAHYAVPGS